MGNSQEIRAKHNISSDCLDVNISYDSREKSDILESFDISNMPINSILEWPSDSILTPRSESEIDDNESDSRTSQDSPRLGNYDCIKKKGSLEEEIQHCFNNLNCITSIDPKFSINIDKFSNKRTLDRLNSSIYAGIMDIDVECSELPEDLYEDVI